MKTVNICIFGDSIGKGVFLRPENSRYAIMKMNLENIIENMKVNIKNYSKFGMTITKGVSVMKRHLEELTAYNRVLLELGGNDCDFNWKDIAENPEGDHLPKTPIPEFRRLYGELLDDIRARDAKPIIINLPPLDPNKYFNWISRGLNADNIKSWLGDVEMIYRWQEMYNIEVMLLAAKRNVPIIDIRSAFLKDNNYSKFLSDDGIHPNQEGYELIYRTVAEELAY